MNKLQGEVPIDFADKRRTLKLTWRACRLFEEKAGMSVDTHFQKTAMVLVKHKIEPEALKDLDKIPVQVQEEILGSASIARTVVLLWSCLEGSDRRLTLEKVEDDLMDLLPGETMAERLTYANERLFEVYRIAKLGDRKPEASGGPPAPPEIQSSGTTS